MDNMAKTRIDMTNTTKDGHTMTIIAYRNSNDIDVQFEDGMVIEHRSYDSFIKGSISYFTSRNDAFAQKRIGETIIATNGLKMTIIAYRNSNDIDVQFENGTIMQHKQYKLFKQGKILDYDNITEKQASERIGMQSVAKNGLKMTIITYRNADDIDIQFEDKTVVQHQRFRAFLQGTIRHPSYSKLTNKQNLRLHERNTNTVGKWMEIIAYRNAHDIDIRFDDGLVLTNCSYTSFKKGEIRYPGIFAANEHDKWIRKTNKVHSTGELMTIVEYTNSAHIIVEFSSTKTRIKTTLHQFLTGQVHNPDFQLHVGETGINRQGLAMKIYKKVGPDSYLIQFDNGYITKPYTYKQFKERYIPNPTIMIADNRIGTVKRMRNGLLAKLVKIENSKNLTVLFEDGITVNHVNYNSFFIKNSVAHPDLTGRWAHHYHGYTVTKASNTPMPNGEYLYETVKDGESTPWLMSLQQLLDKEGVPRIDFSKENAAS